MEKTYGNDISVGAVALTGGGLLGGWWISRRGLGRLWWGLVAALNVPNLVYLALALAPPPALWVTAAAVAVEQFGYGLGFTAYMVYLMKVAGEGITATRKSSDLPHCAMSR